jgi:hypothetical protein
MSFTERNAGGIFVTPLTDPIEQTIRATVRAMNEAWTKGTPDDPSHFFPSGQCGDQRDGSPRLESKDACIAGWKGFCEAARIHRREEIDPVIHGFGDSAAAAYDFAVSFDRNGKTLHSSGRDTFFLVKDGERWWAVAGHFPPYPALSA